MRDPYDVLGVGRSAADSDIKKAYRKLAKANHPDQNPGDSGAQARFSEINNAYEILGDKDKRGQFDRGEIDAEGKPRFQGFAGGQGYNQSGYGQSGFAPEDFADIFAGMGGGRSGASGFRFSSGGGRNQQGQEADDDILSSLFGGFGGGRARSSSGFSGGAGQQSAGASAGRGVDAKAEVAVTLEEVAEGRKSRVDLPTGKSVALTLPKGVVDGQTIRLQGQGYPSATGRGGDALVTVKFVPHPLFRVEGADLHLDLPLSLDEAVLGAKIPVPTLSGKVQITVPARSGNGKVLRLKGKGLPTTSGQGDLLVALKVALPEAAEPELDALMRKWREAGRPSPRGAAFS
ncbi:DnaJ-class molecular chaperone with C-terminal Zn finger domain [Faunimonas pinastri]|uniref:DnaJ-class molecular chaperone with C-terminal Zn finger domain n=1 Tax=Faunimonas pinastri TaxID=1855383 RepID=A0A1H8ZXN9_9HYPH|nr:DnaJ C-terminal domain-containing protein [Faunimonas pinastri]SEP69220.1 DnaJ-class molecular chaperone with C-terminal Zn finger domain [Faunimonas pinastri]